jgi:hypothetical protein
MQGQYRLVSRTAAAACCDAGACLLLSGMPLLLQSVQMARHAGSTQTGECLLKCGMVFHTSIAGVPWLLACCRSLHISAMHKL